MSRKKSPPDDRPAGPFNNPFASLQGKLGPLPEAPPASAAQRAVEPAKGPARAVVRYERKGHGGKEVTVVEQLELREVDLEAWLKDLKRSLGCGGRVEEANLVLQGDQRERLPGLLTARGVRKISVS